MSKSDSSTVKVDYEMHHAVISLVAPIDEATMIDLVACIRELREDYFYNTRLCATSRPRRRGGPSGRCPQPMLG